jgi:hypothetical protein
MRSLQNLTNAVIPVETGIQKCLNLLDSGFRQNDGKWRDQGAFAKVSLLESAS